MKTLKMSLENIQGKLSRAELRKVMAGSDSDDVCKNKSIWCNGGHWSCSEVKAGMCYNSYCQGYCN
jgi:hypothetical protein